MMRPPVPALAHAAPGLLAAQHHATHVDGEDRVEQLGGGVEEGHLGADAGDAREHVRRLAAEGRVDVPERPRDLARIGEIAGDRREALTARGARLGAVDDVETRDERALATEHLGDGLPDAARRAGDHDAAACEASPSWVRLGRRRARTLPSWYEARWYGLFTISANVPYGESRRPVSVGIIGAGNVLPAYLAQLDRLVPRGLARYGPVCARSAARRDELVAMRPGLELVDTAEAVVEADVDIVVVVTPPDVHPAHVRLALQHGKHVLCEKPLAASRAEAEELFELARAHGLHLVSAPVRADEPDLPRALDHHRGRRDRTRPLGPGALRHRRLELGHVVPRRGDRAAARHRHLQPPQPDGPARAGRRDLRRRRDRGAAARRRRHHDRRSPTPTPCTCCSGTRRARSPRSSRAMRSSTTGARRSSCTAPKARPTCSATTGIRSASSSGRTRPAPGGCTRPSTRPGSGPTVCASSCARSVDDRAPRCSESWDLHLVEILESARASIAGRRPVAVSSTFELPELRLVQTLELHHLHDHTRSPDEQ